MPPARPGAGDAAPAGGEQPWDVRVYALNHTAQTLLSSLKVWGALDMARVAPVDAMDVQGDGAQGGRLGFDAFGAHAGTLAWIVEDSNLNAALDAALRFAQNVEVVTGRACRLRCSAATAPRVELEDGAAASRPQLLVGADGRESWVRGQCDIGIDYRSYHQRAIVANFSCEKPHHNVAAPVVHVQGRHHRPAAAAGQQGLAGVVGAGNAGRHHHGRVAGRAGDPPRRARGRHARRC